MITSYKFVSKKAGGVEEEQQIVMEKEQKDETMWELVKEVIESQDLKEDHLFLAEALGKVNSSKESSVHSIHTVVVPHVNRQTLVSTIAAAMERLISSRFRTLALKRINSTIQKSSLSVVYQCGVHKNCELRITFRYLGYLTANALDQEHAICWDPAVSRNCVFLVSRPRLHIEERNKLVLSKEFVSKDFFESLTEEDDTEFMFGMFGPFTILDKQAHVNLNGFKVMNGNEYYIQSVGENWTMQLLIDHFINNEVENKRLVFGDDIQKKVLLFLQRLRNANHEDSVEAYYFSQACLEEIANSDFHTHDHLSKVLSGAIDKKKKVLIVKQNINGLVSHHPKTYEITIPLFDPFLMEDFVRNFLMMAIKWLKLYNEDQLRDLIAGQARQIYENGKLMKYSKHELQQVPLMVHSALGAFLKDQFMLDNNKEYVDALKTTNFIKEQYFHKGQSREEIEKGFAALYLNVASQQELVQKRLLQSEFERKLLDFTIEKLQLENKAYQEIKERLRVQLQVSYFIGEFILHELEQRDAQKYQKVEQLVAELIQAQDGSERSKIQNQIHQTLHGKLQDSAGRKQISGLSVEEEAKRDECFIQGFKHRQNHPLPRLIGVAKQRWAPAAITTKDDGGGADAGLDTEMTDVNQSPDDIGPDGDAMPD